MACCWPGLAGRLHVYRVVGDMCCHGMTSSNGKLVRKPTGWLSNSPNILEQLNLRCTGDHEHQVLEGKHVAAAAVYPDALCRNILVGLRNQLQCDGIIEPGGIGTIAPEEESFQHSFEEWGV